MLFMESIYFTSEAEQLVGIGYSTKRVGLIFWLAISDGNQTFRTSSIDWTASFFCCSVMVLF